MKTLKEMESASKQVRQLPKEINLYLASIPIGMLYQVERYGLSTKKTADGSRYIHAKPPETYEREYVVINNILLSLTSCLIATACGQTP